MHTHTISLINTQDNTDRYTHTLSLSQTLKTLQTDAHTHTISLGSGSNYTAVYTPEVSVRTQRMRRR